jgi:ATP-dependent DNA ligase
MALPVMPPLPPMLARLTRELPLDGYVHEPKSDGFRCPPSATAARSICAAATSGARGRRAT